jgi:hypothetical protein
MTTFSEEADGIRPEPKYKVGQIVVMKGLKKALPFRILKTFWHDGWFYAWNRKNYASEDMIRDMIREVTPEEKGG